MPFTLSEKENNAFEGNTYKDQAKKVVNGAYSLTTTVDTTGVAGSATGSGYLARADSSQYVSGLIDTILVDWNAAAPNTSDIVISVEIGDGFPPQTILSVSNSATDKVFRPKYPAHDFEGNVIATEYKEFLCSTNKIKVSVTGCDALTGAVVVTVVFR